MPRKNPKHNKNYDYSNVIHFHTIDGERRAILLIKQNRELILKEKRNGFHLLGIPIIYANERVFRQSGFNEKEINQIQKV